MPPRACNVRTNAGPARAPRPPLTATTRRPRRTRSRTTYTTGRVRSPITFRMTTDRGCARSGRSRETSANSRRHTRTPRLVFRLSHGSRKSRHKRQVRGVLRLGRAQPCGSRVFRMIIDSPSRLQLQHDHTSALPACYRRLSASVSGSRVPGFPPNAAKNRRRRVCHKNSCWPCRTIREYECSFALPVRKVRPRGPCLRAESPVWPRL